MSRSKETFGKKDVRSKQLKKRKEKEKRRIEKKEQGKTNNLEDMFAWVDANGQLVSKPPDMSKKEEILAENIEVSVPKGGSANTNITFVGRIKNFEDSKSYGFIKCNHQADDVFFHVNDCLGPVKNGDKVEFQIEPGPKGYKGTNVKVIN